MVSINVKNKIEDLGHYPDMDDDLEQKKLMLEAGIEPAPYAWEA